MKHFMKKSISVIMAMIMILAMMMVPAFATPGPLANLTLPSADFTIVGSNGTSHSITMTDGLDANYVPTAIDGSKVNWSSSNTSVVNITSTSYTSTTATVNFNFVGVGRASITATYSDPGVTPVSSNIVVERTTGRVYVAYDVTMKVYLKDAPAGYTIPGWLTTGINFKEDVFINDFTNYLTTPDILKMNPSAMTTVGTLKYFGEISSYTTDSEGGYLEKINNFGAYTDTSTYTYYGWQYRVKDSSGNIIPESVTGSASILQLNDDYTVEWFWGSF